MTLGKLNEIRAPKTDYKRKKAAVNTLLLLLLGLITGVIIKYLDIYTDNLGNVFSQMSVWVFICSLIAVRSCTPIRGGINVFCYCAGMLATYYIVAELTDSVYGMTFVYGWSAFALFSPILGFITWYAKGRHILSGIIRWGIVAVMLLLAVMMFHRVRFADVLFAVLTFVMLLPQKKNT